MNLLRRLFHLLPISDRQRAALVFMVFRLTGDRLNFLPSYRLYLRDRKWNVTTVPANLSAYRASVRPHYHPLPLGEGDKIMLMISHTLGGGTEQHVEDLATRLEAEGWRVLYLQRHNKDHLRLIKGESNLMDQEDIDPLFYRWPDDRSALVADLKTLGVAHLHLHHTVDLPEDFLHHFGEIAVEAERPYDYTVHDYFSICPRFTLFDETVRGYCGEPSDIRKCSACVRHLGSAAGKDVDVATWRADYGALLSSARKVFVPDADVSQRLARYFPAQEFTLRPHPETGGAGGGQQADLFSRRQALGSLREAGGAAQEQSKDSSEQGEAARAVGVTGGGISPLKIVIVGGIAPHKGSKVLFDCAQEALQRNLPLHFTLIGYSDIDAKLKTLKNVTVTGHFTPSELTQKLQAGGFHCAFLPSVIPETYNYVLSQCWQHGLFAVCFDIGAIASRIKAASHLGAILPYEWYYQPEKINDALLALSIPTLPTDLPLTDYTSITRDYYGL